jgi:tetratricopeptide (TPR) repeat protein
MRCCLFLLFLLFAFQAAAQQTKSNEELQKIFVQAEADYKNEKYAEALVGYEVLYKETKQINMIYNIAQCQRALRQFEAALASYQKFLHEQPGSPLKQDIEAVMVTMQNDLAAKGVKTKEQKAELHQKKNHFYLAVGGLALLSAASGTGALLISKKAKEEGNAPPSLRTKGFALAVASDVCFVGAGFTFYLAHKTSKKEASLGSYVVGIP